MIAAQDRRTRRLPRGSMLIETLLAVAAGSLVMLAAIQVIHASMNWSKRIGKQNSHVTEVERLAQSWRDDARQQRTFTLLDGPVARFELGDGSIAEYQVERTHVIRTLSVAPTSSQAAELKPVLHREVYRFPDLTAIEFQKESSPERAVLSIHPKTPDGRFASGSVTVASVVAPSARVPNRSGQGAPR